jgi:hypothetical protein
LLHAGSIWLAIDRSSQLLRSYASHGERQEGF